MSDTDHPYANGAEALVGGLADAGVDLCFSNPGTSELDLVAALEKETRLRTVPVTFEGVATGAADGFARMSGRPAATLLHLAPGFHNASANLHNARKAASPIVAVVGDHARDHRAYDTALSADLEAIASPLSVWLSRVDDARDAHASAVDATREAQRSSGTATLLVSAEAAWTDLSANQDLATAGRVPEPDTAPDIEGAARALAQARQPALLVGGRGLSETGLAACARLSHAGIRILSELFPARHARGAGRFVPEPLQYFTEAAQSQLTGTDLLLVAGTPAPAGTFAYRDRPARPLPEGCEDMVLRTDPRRVDRALDQLADALGAPKSAPIGAAAQERPGQPAGSITLETLALSLRRHLPEDAIVSDDGVTASGFAFSACGGGPRHDWLKLTGGALGLGVPLAIGASLAEPGRRNVCLTGDGAALYTLSSLWTLAREGLDVTVIVIANRSYDILKFELSRMPHINPGPGVMKALSLDPPHTDFAAIARGFGLSAMTCETADDFDRALERALAEGGPQVIEAVTRSPLAS